MTHEPEEIIKIVDLCERVLQSASYDVILRKCDVTVMYPIFISSRSLQGDNPNFDPCSICSDVFKGLFN